MTRVGFILFCSTFAAAMQTAAAGADSKALPVFRNTAKEVGYVGSKVCAGCHPQIYRSYGKTAMGKSLTRGTQASETSLGQLPITIRNEELDRYFKVFRQDQDLYQSEYQLRPDGSQVFSTTQKIEYVVGSGVNGFTYLVRRGNGLFEAPLSYYSRPKAWDLSPSYQTGDYGFSRPIPTACLACHSGRPQPASGPEGVYRDPPFKELAIGCENCHGPGQLHVAERSKGAAGQHSFDSTIVNPARLEGWLADNICMNCHESGAARILKLNKDPLDFRPGTPLDDTVSIFAKAENGIVSPSSVLLSHYSGMASSKCYRQSEGRMSCLSCHNPHVELHTTQEFRPKCLSCHQEANCRLPPAARTGLQPPPDDCAGCHMPKRDVKTISHSALTDHRILAKPDEPALDSGRTSGASTGSALSTALVHLNAVPGAPERLPKDLLLQAYAQILTNHPEFKSAYEALLNELARSEPSNRYVLSGLGLQRKREGTPAAAAEATEYLSRAIQAGSTSPADYQALAELLISAGETQSAIQVLREGIRANPWVQDFYGQLASLYVRNHQIPNAIEVMKSYLKEFPQDSFVRDLLSQVQSAGSR